ncbi:MAG: glycosyltransferase family 2 protein [Leptolyngbya sp. SIO1E4]|nr:glycosyltransferase family 2 protein [Leptolyngbya sp. SIO1E4]
MADFSVVICTYNGVRKLPRLLESLKLQQNTAGICWEVLVIDNNSSEDILSVVRHYQQDWMADVPLRYSFEPQQGLAYARRCAVRQVMAPLIGFLDDDNLPHATWVTEVWRFSHQHPRAGAFGSEVQPLYDVPPPVGFQRIASLLAIVDRGDQPFIYTQRRRVLPAGAGMVIRREAWLAHVPVRPRLSGVANQSLRGKGEDVETLSYIRDAGWEIWHNPAMKVKHHIPAERIQRGYLLELCRSVGLNRFLLRMVRYRPWQRPLVLPLYMLNDLRRLVLYAARNYRSLPEDVVCACEFALLSSSFMSPLYHGLGQLAAVRTATTITRLPQKQPSSH